MKILHKKLKGLWYSSTKYEFFGETHTPTSISALILKKLKEDTERAYGDIDCRGYSAGKLF